MLNSGTSFDLRPKVYLCFIPVSSPSSVSFPHLLPASPSTTSPLQGSGGPHPPAQSPGRPCSPQALAACAESLPYPSSDTEHPCSSSQTSEFSHLDLVFHHPEGQIGLDGTESSRLTISRRRRIICKELRSIDSHACLTSWVPGL